MGKKISLKDAQSLPPIVLLQLLKIMKEKLKQDDTVKLMFKTHNVHIDYIDHIPMCFTNLDVNAKCDHAVIYFDYKLLCDGDFESKYDYAVHEITHWLDQSFGNGPTQGSDEGVYLDNKFEQKGFKNQIKYISDHDGEDEAQKYVENLLNYHDVKGKDKKDELEAILTEDI